MIVAQDTRPAVNRATPINTLLLAGIWPFSISGATKASVQDQASIHATNELIGEFTSQSGLSR